MAVSVYQCDTCNRETQRAQNRKGLDVIGRCIITDGCRGKLSLVGTKPNHAYPKSAPLSLSLNDWSPRRMLYTHTQSYLNNVWEIEHNLNTHPSVIVYVYINNILTKIDPEVEYTSNNTIKLSFSTARDGIAQCVARTASDGATITSLKPVQATLVQGVFTQAESSTITSGSLPGEITIATRINDVAITGIPQTDTVTATVRFLSPLNLQPVPAWDIPIVFPNITSTPVDSNASPWSFASKVVIGGHRYMVRSANLGTTLATLGIPSGTAYYIEYTSHTINKGDVYYLLASDPFSSADIITNSAIDASTILQQSAPENTIAIGGDLLITNRLLKQLYPSIITIR